MLALLLSIPAGIATAQETDSVLVEGFVHDRNTQERLEGATVLFNHTTATATDGRGYFSMHIQAESLLVNVSLVGYLPAEKRLQLEGDEEVVKLFFQLVQAPVQMESVLVVGARKNSATENGILSMSPSELQALPRFGEADPLRSIQAMPGVTQATTDFDAHVYVRGGQAYETQVLLDGIPVYNPYHLSGWLSIFSTEVLRSQTLYRSGYPLYYGSFLSGALNLETKAGSSERYQGSATLGIPSLRGYVEGPLAGGTFVLSARRTYLDALGKIGTGKKGPSNDLPYYFYDLFGKYTRSLGEDDIISCDLFCSRDSYDPYRARPNVDIRVDENPAWANTVLGFSHAHRFSPEASVTTTVYYTRSTVYANAQSELYNQMGTVGYPFPDPERILVIDNIMREAGGRVVAEFSSGAHKVQAGLLARDYRVKNAWTIHWPSYSDTEEILIPRAESFLDYAGDAYASSGKAFSLAAFVSDEIALADRLSLSLGYRIEKLSGLASPLHAPTAALGYMLTGDIDLSLKYNRYYQYLYSLKESKTKDNIFSSFAASFLSEDAGEVSHADQVSLGCTVRELPLSLALEAEGYYSNRRNLPSSYNGPTPLRTFERGYAVGLDLLLKTPEASLSGWFAYSLSRSVKNTGEYWYFSGADRTHSLKAMLGYRPFESLRFDAFWTYASGVPYTIALGKFLGEEYDDGLYPGAGMDLGWRPIEGRKNASRAIAYMRLDLGVTAYWIWGKTLIMPFFQVFNVTRSPNPFFIDWGKAKTIGESRQSEIMPSLGVTVEF